MIRGAEVMIIAELIYKLLTTARHGVSARSRGITFLDDTDRSVVIAQSRIRFENASMRIGVRGIGFTGVHCAGEAIGAFSIAWRVNASRSICTSASRMTSIGRAGFAVIAASVKRGKVAARDRARRVGRIAQVISAAQAIIADRVVRLIDASLGGALVRGAAMAVIAQFILRRDEASR